jgi:hypothetical protein
VALVRPVASITVRGRAFSSAQAGLLHVATSASLCGEHDEAELWLHPSSKLRSAATGDELTVALGDEDVLAGEVSEFSWRGQCIVLLALCKTAALSRTYKNETYADQSVADVVRDLASSVDIDQVEGDTQLNSYSVDDRRAVWSHLRDLAVLAGAELGSTAAGGLRCVQPRTGSADETLRYGADVLAWDLGPAQARTAARIAAYGAGSESGSERWHWIAKAPSPVGSGDGPLQVVAAARTRDVADRMQRGRAAAAARSAVRGRLLLAGKPGLRAGALLDITGAPSDVPASLRVVAVRHALDARSGFTTLATVEAASGAGGLS